VLGNAISVAAGDAHSCAVLGDGTVWCWGWGGAGQLGHGSLGDSNIPVQVTGLPPAIQVAARERRTYALLTDGTVRAWGNGCDGRLGAPNTSCTSYSTPRTVENLAGVRAVAAGHEATCAVKTDGTAWCWGSGWHGQLGTSTYDTERSPVQVTSLTGVVDLAVGGGHACAVTMDGTVSCWGNDRFNQLGDGVAHELKPTPARLVCGG
jgi:alpha-tubulin suppressor-like RCC1 family protein